MSENIKQRWAQEALQIQNMPSLYRVLHSFRSAVIALQSDESMLKAVSRLYAEQVYFLTQEWTPNDLEPTRSLTELPEFLDQFMNTMTEIMNTIEFTSDQVRDDDGNTRRPMNTDPRAQDMAKKLVEIVGTANYHDSHRYCQVLAPQAMAGVSV